MAGDDSYGGGNRHECKGGACKRRLELGELFSQEMKKKEKAIVVVLAGGKKKLLGLAASWSSCWREKEQWRWQEEKE